MRQLALSVAPRGSGTMAIPTAAPDEKNQGARLHSVDQMDGRSDLGSLGSRVEWVNPRRPCESSDGPVGQEAPNRLARGVECGRGRGRCRFDQSVSLSRKRRFGRGGFETGSGLYMHPVAGLVNFRPD